MGSITLAHVYTSRDSVLRVSVEQGGQFQHLILFVVTLLGYRLSCSAIPASVDVYLYLELDGVSDELRVFLDHLLDPSLLEVLHLVLLQEERDLGASAEVLRLLFPLDSERTSGRRLPDVLLVIVVLERDLGGGGGEHE